MDEEKDYVYVDIYADSTCLFTDEFCDDVSNVITVQVEREVVFEFFKEFVKEDLKDEDWTDNNWDDEKFFEEWLTGYYTCDDFEPEGFYDWCVKKGSDIRIHGIK